MNPIVSALGRYHRIYGDFGAARAAAIIYMPLAAFKGWVDFVVIATFALTGWFAFVQPPQTVTSQWRDFPPPIDRRFSLFPPDSPQSEWSRHHVWAAMMTANMVVSTWVALPLFLLWLWSGDHRHWMDAWFVLVFFPFVGLVFDIMISGHGRSLAAARSTRRLTTTPSGEDVEEPTDNSSHPSANTERQSAFSHPYLLYPLMTVPLIALIALILTGVFSDKLLHLLAAIIAFAYAMGLVVEWSINGRQISAAMFLDAGTHAALVIVLCVVIGYGIPFVGLLAFKVFGHHGSRFAAGLAAIGGHLTLTLAMHSAWRKGPEVGTRSGPSHAGQRFQAWQPGPSVAIALACHDRVFFAPPPPDIGTVRAAYTSMRGDSSPLGLPPRLGYALLLGVAVTVPGWLLAPLAGLSDAALVALLPLSFCYGMALGWFITDASETCVFVGSDGIWQCWFAADGPMPTSGFFFTNADAAYVSGTEVVSPRIGGQPTGERYYEYSWVSLDGNRVHELKGHYHVRNYRESSLAELDDAALEAWTAHRHARYLEDLASGHSALFPILCTSGTSSILLGSNGAELDENNVTVPIVATDIGNGTMTLTLQNDDVPRLIPISSIGNFGCFRRIMADLKIGLGNHRPTEGADA
ncbi:hypothetical protein [Paramagnetospirillum magneticum]|uniref:Uncharacterized protein n=1 Tax=Paramagnetospirillum magneticum (strain ATCC 700264 / AMB-1) TaxID=342108 RepID=Q2W6M5_PARM1|nr:hypothetical protein [Paramagnetospirillum magneticum]BAE50500.1 hypothetical protein amb1696 [Paramagnetospirillum magneticum AMB-1]